MTDLYPDSTRHPYYIVTPPWTRFSAGIKALHLLCNALNRRGQQAFLLILPDMPPGVPVMQADLLTPRLTQAIVDAHRTSGRTPIVVYPETITGNPMRAPVVARYVLNTAGLLGGEVAFTPDEIVFPYSASLAQTEEQARNVLHLPVTDTSIFHPPAAGTVRHGSCYYAMKYKQNHPGNFMPPAPDSIEITFAQTPRELAEIFRRVETMYCYEATSTALDAALCGCPIVSLPNEHLTAPIASGEMEKAGHAWGNTPEEVARAKATVGLVFERHQASIVRFGEQLGHFVALTQERAAATRYATALRTPFARPWSGFLFPQSVFATIRARAWRGDGVIRRAWQALRRDGVRRVLRRLERGTVA